MIVDAHVNITEDGKWGNTGFDASVDNLLGEMDSAKVDKALLLPVKGMGTTSHVVQTVKQHSDRFFGFGTLSIHSFEEDIQKVVDAGLGGFKFHPRFQEESPQLLDELGILDHLAEHGLPIMICGWLQSKTIPLQDLQPMAIDLLAKRNPGVNFIISHMGCHKYWDAFFVARSNANVFLDCSYFLNFFKNTSLATDFYKSLHLVDQKVFFGSDFPELNIGDYLDMFLKGIAGDEAVDREAVLSGNIMKLLT